MFSCQSFLEYLTLLNSPTETSEGLEQIILFAVHEEVGNIKLYSNIFVNI